MSSNYDGSKFILSDDKSIFKTHSDAVAASQHMKYRHTMFDVGDPLFLVENYSITEFVVMEVTRSSSTTLSFHCEARRLNHSTYRCCFTSDSDQIFKTLPKAELFVKKLNYLVEVHTVPSEKVPSPIVSRFSEDDLIYDIERLHIRCGRVREVHEWPGGFMYYCHSDYGSRYVVHSNELIYDNEDAADMAMYHNFSNHKLFNVDQIIFYAVGGKEVALHRVTRVQRDGISDRFYITQALDMFLGCTFRSDDRTIFATQEEAQHYNMQRELENQLLASKALECTEVFNFPENIPEDPECSPTAPVSPGDDSIELLVQEANSAIEDLRAVSDLAIMRLDAAVRALKRLKK